MLLSLFSEKDETPSSTDNNIHIITDNVKIGFVIIAIGTDNWMIL